MANSPTQATFTPATIFIALAMSVLTPAVAQNSAVVELDPSMAKLLRFEKPLSTIIIGDPTIAEATAQGNQIVALTGKKPGITNLIVLDASNQELFNAPIAVGEVTKGVGRVTLHATFGRGGSGALQKFHVYRCARGRLCEIVKEPEVIVQRDVADTTKTSNQSETP